MSALFTHPSNLGTVFICPPPKGRQAVEVEDLFGAPNEFENAAVVAVVRGTPEHRPAEEPTVTVV